MRRIIKRIVLSFIVVTSLAFNVSYASLIIPIAYVDEHGQGRCIGTVRADDTIYGLLLQPNLRYLPPGLHGFSVNTLPFCHDFGTASDGHFDPEHNFQHRGPFRGNGHLGDLPVLMVASDRRATLPVLAPRLKLSQIQGRSLVIIAGGDNYSDRPLRYNNSKIIIACGVIPYH